MRYIKIKMPIVFAFWVCFIMICGAGAPMVKKAPSALIQTQEPIPVNPPPEQPLGKLTITSPKSGDHLVAGRELVIQWSAEGYVPEKCVRITYIQMPFGPFEINPRVCVKDRLEAITTKEAKLKALVKNMGEVTSGISVARWRIEGHGTQNFNVPNLGPGQTFEIKREVTWLTGGTDNFTVEVDKNNQVRELSETDNVKNGTIHRHVWGTPIAPFDNSPKCPEYGIN